MAGTCTEDNANVSQLLEGFDALISKIDLLVETNRMLEQQIQEYTSPKVSTFEYLGCGCRDEEKYIGSRSVVAKQP